MPALATRWVRLGEREFLVRLAAGEPVSIYERKPYGDEGRGVVSPYWHAGSHPKGGPGSIVARILAAAKGDQKE